MPVESSHHSKSKEQKRLKMRQSQDIKRPRMGSKHPNSILDENGRNASAPKNLRIPLTSA